MIFVRVRRNTEGNLKVFVFKVTVSVGVHLLEDLLRPLLRCRLVLRHLHDRGHHLVDCLQRDIKEVISFISKRFII